MAQLHPELDNVLQCLSLNGSSVFSPIDDIPSRCNWEDERIKTLREGMESDAAGICACLLCHINSGPAERVSKFGRVQLPIDILLLEIFDPTVSDWQALVHVCQSWKNCIGVGPHLGLTTVTALARSVPKLLIRNRDTCHFCPEDEDSILAVPPSFLEPPRMRDQKSSGRSGPYNRTLSNAISFSDLALHGSILVADPIFYLTMCQFTRRKQLNQFMMRLDREGSLQGSLRGSNVCKDPSADAIM